MSAYSVQRREHNQIDNIQIDEKMIYSELGSYPIVDTILLNGCLWQIIGLLIVTLFWWSLNHTSWWQQNISSVDVYTFWNTQKPLRSLKNVLEKLRIISAHNN